MKPASILTTVFLTYCFTNKRVDATGYKPDPTHRYEHKEDLEKLLHPNTSKEILVVSKDQNHRSTGNVNANVFKSVDDGEELDSRGRRSKVLMMGMKNRYVPSREIQNVVTKILDASAAIERESVVASGPSSPSFILKKDDHRE